MTDQEIDHQPQIIICTTSDTQTKAREYATRLEDLGYGVDIYTVEKVSKIFQAQTLPEIVIAFSPDDCLRLNDLFSDNPTELDPPLLVALSQNDSYPSFMLPADPTVSLPLIQSSLQLKSENRRLRKGIQDLKRRNEELMKSSEYQKRTSHAAELLKNAIVRNVSHELRTPLLQVKAAVSLIAEDVENTELVNLAKGATSRLEILIKNITMLGSSLDIKRSAVIIPETIEYAKRNLSRIWNQKDAIDRIEVNLPDNLPAVYADKVGLGTVIQLLIDNALKFSDQSVTVLARTSNNNIEFEVRDNGIGVPDTQLEHIFELFYQIESSTTRKYGGTGVGLALAKLILENHETEIDVRSKVGKGTAFTFQLPVYRW